MGLLIGEWSGVEAIKAEWWEFVKPIGAYGPEAFSLKDLKMYEN